MSIPSSGSSTWRSASNTSSFVGMPPKSSGGRAGSVELEVRAAAIVARERRAPELRHREEALELDDRADRGRRALALDEPVAGPVADEEEVGRLERLGLRLGLACAFLGLGQ